LYHANDVKNVDVKHLQVMRSIFYYNSLVLVSKPKTQVRKGFLYNTTNGIIALKEHVFTN